MRQAFNFYSSYDEVISDLSDKQLSLFIRSMLDVQFFRVDIDSVTFEDKILSIVWKASKHSIKKQIEGYCNANKIDYKSLFCDVEDAHEAPYEAPYEASLKGALIQGEEKGEEKGEVQEQVEYPLWLCLDTWNEWVLFRKEKKSKLTNRTIKMQVKFLGEHVQDHVAIINQSIMNGWTGLFELKSKPKQRTTYQPVNGMSASQLRDHLIEKEMQDNGYQDAINQ